MVHHIIRSIPNSGTSGHFPQLMTQTEVQWRIMNWISSSTKSLCVSHWVWVSGIAPVYSMTLPINDKSTPTWSRNTRRDGQFIKQITSVLNETLMEWQCTSWGFKARQTRCKPGEVHDIANPRILVHFSITGYVYGLYADIVDYCSIVVTIPPNRHQYLILLIWQIYAGPVNFLDQQLVRLPEDSSLTPLQY